MIVVTGQARFADGEIERLRVPLNAWIARVRERNGCDSYAYTVDLADPNLLHVVEHWRDEAAVDAHMADMAQLMDSLAGAGMLSISVKAYEGTYLKTLMGE